MEYKDWKEIKKIIYKTGKSWSPEEQMSYEEYLAREIELYVQAELDKAREEGRRDALKEVEYTLAKDTRYEFLFTEIKDIISKLNK